MTQKPTAAHLLCEIYESERKYYLVPVATGKAIKKANDDDESWDIRELGAVYPDYGPEHSRSIDAMAFAKKNNISILDEIEQIFY